MTKSRRQPVTPTSEQRGYVIRVSVADTDERP
jgi:hypothetical protein